MLRIEADIKDAVAMLERARAAAVPGHAADRFRDLGNRIAVEQIKTQGARAGNQYPPLAPSTVAARIRRGNRPGPPLIETGRLLAQMGRGAVAVDGTGAVVSWTTDYGHFHQSDAPRARLPQRKVLDPTQADADDAAAEWLASFITEVGG